MKIYLSAGHSSVRGLDMGAVGQGFIEGELTEELKTLIANELVALGNDTILDSNEMTTGTMVRHFLKKLIGVKDALVVDIHFNASSNSAANGTEVIVRNGASTKEILIGTKLSMIISTALRSKNRGLKYESQTARGSLYLFNIKVPTVLIEICFITNESDMLEYQARKGRIAKAIADYLHSL